MTEHRNNSTQKQWISSFEPGTMFLGTILAVLSAIVCMQILGKVGVSANTSILGNVVNLRRNICSENILHIFLLFSIQTIVYIV